MSKKVSIIIPVYNGANYLKEAIESALAQTYKNIEIVVVNDGSTDNGATDKIAKSYGDKIKYYLKENGGAASALNYGISKMTGDYMSWLSHDDLYYPEKIEKEIKEIEKYDENTILFSNFDLIDPKGNKFDTVIYDHKMLKKKPDYAVLRGCIGGITLLIPKHILDECGEFRKDLRCVQDYEMWFRMLSTGKYKFVHMEDVLTATRIHPGQDTQTSPKMVTEGNWLWIYMTENYPKEKKIEYESCEYLFYKEMENYLENTPYKDAINRMNELAQECLNKEKNNKVVNEATVIIIDDKDKDELNKTKNSVKNQQIKSCVIIECKKDKLADAISKVKTEYYSILYAGVEAKDNWLEEELVLASATNKGVIISDYNRPIKSGVVDNYCSFLTPIDGVILKKTKVNYKNDISLMLDTALVEGSFVTGNHYLTNVVEKYQMDEVFDYVKTVIGLGKSNSLQIASLNYDVACIYNRFAKEGRKVSMYEDCDEYRTLKFSRSFRMFKKYYDYKQKKRKKL